jgi:hypothetical protein
VVSNAIYDYYWPGYEDSAPLGHNTVCLLTEVARVDIATPITVPAAELRGQRGLPSHAPQVNFPDPWRGGRWTLRDIVDYDFSAVRGLLHAVSAYRERIVQNFYEMGAHAVEAGRRGEPFAFVIPSEQYDPHAAAALEELLIGGAIEIHRALQPFVADDVSYPAGTDIILLAQPYRAYVKTLLERQHYPARRGMTAPASTAATTPVPSLSLTAPAAALSERPYDVAGWTLPMQMGIDVRTIERPFQPPETVRVTRAAAAPARVLGDPKPSWYVIDARGNGGALAINRLVAAGASVSWTTNVLEIDGYSFARGSLVIPYSKAAEPVVEAIATHLGLRATGVKRRPAVATSSIGGARVALYKPWLENTDEGWTRWLLEHYEFRLQTIADAEVRAGSLRARYDAIILPAAPASQLLMGNEEGSVPAEYVGGLGEPGRAALKAFVAQGGTLICLDEAGALAIATFELPIRDVAGVPEKSDAGAGDFFCPGSIIRLEVDPATPGSYGMPVKTAGFFSFSSAYDVGDAAGMHVNTRYATADLLLSGWLEGESVIAGRAAAVDVSVGAGRVVLLGFPVQHRAQSHATFRLLFNAIFTSRLQ